MGGLLYPLYVPPSIENRNGNNDVDDDNNNYNNYTDDNNDTVGTGSSEKPEDC